MSQPFTREEAVSIWSRLVAGWAKSLDNSGARTLMAGVPSRADAGGSYEGVTRMIWGLSSWLSQPQRPSLLSWRGETFDTEVLLTRALLSGTDPESPGYWGTPSAPGAYDQRTVESGQVAFGTWLSRERVWANLTVVEQAKVGAWLSACGQRPNEWRNNWALFWGLNHAARKGLELPHEQALIDETLDYLEEVYCGDGWYDDGPKRGVKHFDDYNLWVFGTHALAWTMCDGDSQPERRERLLARVRENMMHFPYFFGADGAYTEYGRSLAYKFARLGAPLLAYKLGAWPHSIGLLRRLVGLHLRWYLDRGALYPDGTLRQALTAEGSVEIREPYVGTGSPYWAMLAFTGLWSLADDDPFWTAEEAPLPVEEGDFVKVLDQPGWVLAGSKASGAVQRFNAGSEGYPAKYGKFLYATAAPFNVGLADGQPAPDSMLSLTDGHRYGHRFSNLASAVGAPGWLRMRYTQEVAGDMHLIDTTILVLSEGHLRAHRVQLGSSGPVAVVEGAAPLGYSSGTLPVIKNEDGWEVAEAEGRAVAILPLQGYDGQHPASSWKGRHDLNSVYGHYLFPWLTVSALQPQHDLVCLVYTGRAGAELAALRAQLGDVGWLEDGTFRAVLHGQVVEVPPLERLG